MMNHQEHVADTMWRDVELIPHDYPGHRLKARILSNFRLAPDTRYGHIQSIPENDWQQLVHDQVLYMYAYEFMSVIPRGTDGRKFFNRAILAAMTTLGAHDGGRPGRKVMFGNYVRELVCSKRRLNHQVDLVVYHKLWVAVHV